MSGNLSEMEFGRLARGAEAVPPVPGTRAVPKGHARLMHSVLSGPPTPELVQGVKNDGLTMRSAKGESYGEPNAIWAVAGSKPYNETAANVEFSAPPEDLDIGRYRTPEDLEARASHVTLLRDVRPEEFIGVHEPWHRTYRLAQEDSRVSQSLVQGEYDDMIEDAEHYPSESRALREAKTDLAVSRLLHFGEDL